MARVRHLGGLGSIASAGGEGGGAVEFIGAATTFASSGTSATFALPAGLQKGDLLLAAVTFATGSSNISVVPGGSGWFIIATEVATNGTFALLGKYSDGTETSGTVAISGSTISRMAIVALAYRGAKRFQTNGIAQATAATITATGITPIFTGKCLAIFGSAAAQASVTTAPAGTLRGSALSATNTTCGIAVYEQDAPADTATGAKAITFPNSGRSFGSQIQVFP